MRLRYPSDKDYRAIYAAAHRYAKQSLCYTSNASGWHDGLIRKYRRIVIGRFGQEWLRVVFLHNGIDGQEDPSDHTQPDHWDFQTLLGTLDVKTNGKNGIRYQVNHALKHKPITYYVFLEITSPTPIISSRTEVHALGVMKTPDYWEKAYVIPHGECFPGKTLCQRFASGSGVLALNRHTPLPDGIASLQMVSLDHFLWLHQQAAHIQAQQEEITALKAQMQQYYEGQPILWESCYAYAKPSGIE
jgi:hypothetical protein